MKISVPPHIYEQAAQIVAARYSDQVEVQFLFMPVRFGGVQAYASFSRRLRPGRAVLDGGRAGRARTVT